MAIVLVQVPDSISLSGNLKELVMQSANPVDITLKAGAAILLEETYYPGNGNLVHIDLREVVESYLSFTIPSSDVFLQPLLARPFTVEYKESGPTLSFSFTAVRGGKLNLTQSADAFLKENFLTWQPNQKPVSYYSPEWLTYFAPVASRMRLKAYWEDGTNSVITLSSLLEQSCTTVNLQYAVVSGKFQGKRPMYYDVWVESDAGVRLSYVQRYLASEKQSDNENWYLFENSLGGLDCLRAYGSLQDTPDYTHNLTTKGDTTEEYRVDTDRLHVRNTGYLTAEEARWLQDLFPSRQKYVYTLSGLFPIVFTDSDGKGDTTDLPSSYSFTYRMADTRPYLDIQRQTDLPENLTIPIPTGETFFLPPRLAEFPKPRFSDDLLIPVQEPHTEVWGSTTSGVLRQTVLNDLINSLDGLELNPTQGGGGGGSDIYLIKEFDLTLPTDINAFSSLRTLKEIDNAMSDIIVDIDSMFLRKDIDDTAHGIITFDQKIGSSIFIEGYDGKGWEINEKGDALINSARVRSNLFVGNKFGSPTFASGFTGWGVEIDIPSATAEMDNLFIRKTFTAYEIVYSQIYGLGGSQIVSDLNKIASVEVLPDRYRCYMDDMDGLMLMNLRKGDGVRIQTRTGTTSIKYLMGRCIGVDSDYFDIAIPLLEGTGQPETGDFAMRWGSKEDINRQGLIYLTTADSGAPFIDVYDGITDVSTEGKLKARLGNLKGIRTMQGDQLSGYGAYLSGVYIENSTYYTDTGETVDQRFVAMNGKFESTIEGIRQDISQSSGNILRNSSFSANTNYWTSANTVRFMDVGGSYLWMDGSFYVEKDKVADIYTDSDRRVLRIRNTYILQTNEIMNLPDNPEGKEATHSFALFYKVLRPGSCGFGVPGTDLYLQQQLAVSDGYQKISKVGKWNGSGNFELRFTGEILIYGVSLFSDEMADAILKLQTQIDQTDEYIKLLATKDYVDAETGDIYLHYDSKLEITAEQMSGISTKVDNINNTINTAGWITRSESISLFASKEQVKGLESSVATLSVQYDQIFSAVGNNTKGISDAKDLANKAFSCGLYSQEQYSQTSNPWGGWPSGQEFKHVGALWYNPSTKAMKRYTGINGSDSWESVSAAETSSASFVLQNKNKWQLIVANFDESGNPTEESGLLTTAYGNILYARKDNLISSINQSPGSITIEASKINLVGATRIGAFTIENGWLKCNSNAGNEVGYIDMRGTETRIAFGHDFAPATAGGAFSCTAIIKNHQVNHSTPGLTEWFPVNKGIALQISSMNSDWPIALDSHGYNKFMGGLNVLTFTPTIGYNWDALPYQDIFILQTPSDLTLPLPTQNKLFEVFNGGSNYMANGLAISYQSIIKFTFILSRYSKRVFFTGNSGGYIINTFGGIHNAGDYTYGRHIANPGEIVTFYYYNGNYYINSNAF